MVSSLSWGTSAPTAIRWVSTEAAIAQAVYDVLTGIYASDSGPYAGSAALRENLQAELTASFAEIPDGAPSSGTSDSATTSRFRSWRNVPATAGTPSLIRKPRSAPIPANGARRHPASPIHWRRNGAT
jgi:hypothetical protein